VELLPSAIGSVAMSGAPAARAAQWLTIPHLVKRNAFAIFPQPQPKATSSCDEFLLFNGMPDLADDEALIEAVLRVRVDQPGLTAAEVHAALVAEGNAGLELPRVKKAASKATKRQAKAPPAATGAPAPAEAPISSKKSEKAAKAAEATMKAAETFMMEANRNLRLALGDDEYSAAIQTSDRGEKFIQHVTERALEAKLAPAEASLAVRERLAADLATLEWMLLAEKAGTLTLPEEARDSAVARVERLQKTKESKAFKQDKSWVSDCFILPEDDSAPGNNTGPPSGIDYAANSRVTDRQTSGGSLDRAVAKAGMLSVGGGFDDDID